MKDLIFTLVLACGLEHLRAQPASQAKPSAAGPGPTAKRVVDCGANHRVWQWEPMSLGLKISFIPRFINTLSWRRARIIAM